MTTQTLTLRVNGGTRTVQTDDPDTPLLYVLRGDLGLTGTRFGCGLAQCGACTVLVDGRAVRSCATPARAVQGRDITTIEGLGSPERPDPVQAAFIAEQAAQCGYCTAGMVVTARALLQQSRRPSEAEVRQALAGNLCRCGSHARVIRAVMRAAAAMAGGRSWARRPRPRCRRRSGTRCSTRPACGSARCPSVPSG
jgi:nicotinate dehydrogenase subunit A